MEVWITYALLGKVRFKSILVSCICLHIRRRLMTFSLRSLAAALCMCVCICVHVPKLQHGVELLCASFCYVMKNHIRIHFTAGQAWRLGMLSVLLSPSTCSSCPVLLHLLLLIICPLRLLLCRPPHAWQENVLCLSLSLLECVYVYLCMREICV